MVGASQGVRIGLGCAAAAWAAAIVPAACGDGEGRGERMAVTPLVQSLCRKLVECGCGDAFTELGVPVPLDCSTWSLADHGLGRPYDGYDDYGYWSDSYDEEIRSIDEECVQRLADRVDAIACGEPLDDPADCRASCSVIVGPGLAGSGCGGRTFCSAGLVCDRGVCTDPCEVRPPVNGDRCVSASDCGADLVCTTIDFEQEVRACVPLPLAGQECLDGECGAGLACEDGVCVTPVAVGEACTGHRECGSGYCPAGRCAPPPGEGERCGFSGACASGLRCNYEDGGEGTCRALPPPACYVLFDALLVFDYF